MTPSQPPGIAQDRQMVDAIAKANRQLKAQAMSLFKSSEPLPPTAAPQTASSLSTSAPASAVASETSHASAVDKAAADLGQAGTIAVSINPADSASAKKASAWGFSQYFPSRTKAGMTAFPQIDKPAPSAAAAAVPMTDGAPQAEHVFAAKATDTVPNKHQLLLCYSLPEDEDVHRGSER